MYQLRQANKADAKDLVPLLLSSAPRAFPRLFDLSPSHTAIGYLQHALSRPDGQFGYANHWVIADGQHVLAIGCCWQNELPNGFVAATVDSLASYYPTGSVLSILHRCQLLQGIFPRPTQVELCIGHLAVMPAFRRQALATRLLRHFESFAKGLGMLALTLDVARDNQVAIACYQRCGFTVSQTLQDNSELALGHYDHLRKAL